MLPLAAEETAWPVARFGDRIFVGIARFEAAFDYQFPLPASLGSRLVSMDACGRDRRTVAEELEGFYVPTDAGQPWLAVDREMRLVWLDPEGLRPPRLVDAGALPTFSRLGPQIIIQVEGQLSRQEFDGAGPTTRTPLPDTNSDWVVVAQPGSPVDATATILATQGSGGTLVEIDPIRGSQLVRREGVGTFDTSKDGRWILWWPRGAAYDEETFPRLWDRGTDAEIELAAPWTLFSTKLGPGGVVQIAEGGTSTKLTLFDDLRQVELDGDYTIRAVGAEGTLLLEAGNLSGYGDSYTLERGETTPILRWDTRSIYTWADDDAFWLIAQTTGAAPSPFDPPHADMFASVIRIPYDTLQPEIIAPNLWEPLALPGGRWVGTREYANDNIGELWVHEPSGAEFPIDDDVFAWFSRMNRPFEPDFPLGHPGFVDNSWLYLVMDEARQRRGLWSVSLEPVPM